VILIVGGNPQNVCRKIRISHSFVREQIEAAQRRDWHTGAGCDDIVRYSEVESRVEGPRAKL